MNPADNEGWQPSLPDEAYVSDDGDWVPDYTPENVVPLRQGLAHAVPKPGIAAQSLKQGQVQGDERFDLELEDFLTRRGWHVKRNIFSGNLEVHKQNCVLVMTDDLLTEIQFSLSYASNGKEPARAKVSDALSLIGRNRAYHPVRDYLAGLKWDGVQRLDNWLTDYLGAEDTPLNRAIARKVLCAAVRRVHQPGCKFDHMLVLQGAQGLGKSSLLREICPRPEWFTDQLEAGDDAKTTMEKAAGAWIAEIPELSGLGKRDTRAVKKAVSTQTDKARLAYERYATERGRQFIMAGSTNEGNYLDDITGNRRFWPVLVTKADVDRVKEVRDQLWAEAVLAESDENLWMDTHALKAAVEAVARSVTDYGPWFEALGEALGWDAPMKVSSSDAWKVVGIHAADVNRLEKRHHENMHRAMTGLGFEKRNQRQDGDQTKCWVRGEAHAASWWQFPDTSHQKW